MEEKWKQPAELFLEKGGILLVLGGIDTGKSTFCRFLCSYLLRKNIKCALIDADPGQADVGPPACIGMALISQELPLWEGFTPDEIHFVGSTTPAKRLLQCLTGVVLMKEKASAAGASHVIVNTSGWIDGGAAPIYKHNLISVLNPSIIVGIRKRGELGRILSPYKGTGIKIFSIKPSKEVVPKDRDTRRDNRNRTFADYFNRSVIISPKPGTTGITGTAFPPRRADVKGQAAALIDDKNRTLGLGIITDYDVKTDTFTIKTPYRGSPRKIRRLHFEDFTPPEYDWDR